MKEEVPRLKAENDRLRKASTTPPSHHYSVPCHTTAVCHVTPLRCPASHHYSVPRHTTAVCRITPVRCAASHHCGVPRHTTAVCRVTPLRCATSHHCSVPCHTTAVSHVTPKRYAMSCLVLSVLVESNGQSHQYSVPRHTNRMMSSNVESKSFLSYLTKT